MKLNIKNTFTSQLPADPITDNSRRQVTKACYSFVTPKQTAKPKPTKDRSCIYTNSC